ncbi:MAG: hypothetical protein ACJA2P_001342 [Rhodoferax sp.]|jgi:hypothetical protein
MRHDLSKNFKAALCQTLAVNHQLNQVLTTVMNPR